MRILDPSGACTDLLKAKYPDAQIDQVPDGLYDAILFYGDLDNRLDPDARLKALTEHIGPNGRVYVSVSQGRRPGGRTPGRKRAWRSVDVASLMRRHGVIHDMGVDDQGYVSGSFSPAEKRAQVTIFTGQAIGGWHPLDIEQRGLGGSETAAWRLSEELSDRGYVVTLFGDFAQQGAVKDVILRHWTNFDPTVHQRGLVVFRSAEPFDKPVNADKVILWLEDVAGAEGLTPERAERIDHICTVSKWHTQDMAGRYPWLEKAKLVTSRNGITHSFFGGEAPEREKRVLYTSSPDRGLDIVLECWPEIRAQIPDAVLTHCYGPWYDICADRDAGIMAHRARINELSRADGVQPTGQSLGQRALATLMRSSLVWCHPSYNPPSTPYEVRKFNETNCISCQEAQAAGCHVVAANWGALTEMVKVGARIDGDPMNGAFRKRFVAEIVKGLTDPQVQQHAQAEGPKAMASHGWGPVADQLERLIGG